MIRPLSHEMKDFPDRSVTSCNTVGTRGEAESGAPAWWSRFKTARLPNLRRSQLCNAEHFVYFVFLVSVGVVA